MNIANIYRKLKQILNDSNEALVNKGLNKVNSLNEISSELEKLEINRLPYILNKQIIELTRQDFGEEENIQQPPKQAFSDLNLIKAEVPLLKYNALGMYTPIENLTIFKIKNGLDEIPSNMNSSSVSKKAPWNSGKHIIIENDIIGIGIAAFENAYIPQSITLPSSIVKIGANAFSGCKNLADIYLKSTIPPALGNTSAIPTTTIIHVPIGSGDTYRAATNWSNLASQIVEDIEN